MFAMVIPVDVYFIFSGPLLKNVQREIFYEKFVMFLIEALILSLSRTD